MKKFQKGFIAPSLLIIFAIVVVVGSFYLYSSRKKPVPLKTQEQISQDIEDIKIVVAKEEETLNFLVERYDSEKIALSKIQEVYSSISDDILKKTDILFNNPESQKPDIKLKVSTKIENDINSKREQITEVLNSWNDTIQLIYSNPADTSKLPSIPALLQDTKNDISAVKEYVKELEKIVDSLTPANSGLTEQEINSYQNTITSTQTQVDNAISTINAIVVSTAQTQTTLVAVPVSQNTEVSNPPNTQVNPDPSPVASPEVPIVTPAQIQTQEEVVANAQANLALLEQTIATTTIPVIDPPKINYSIPEIFTPVGTTFQGIDKSGWPDQTPDENSVNPSLLQGTN